MRLPAGARAALAGRLLSTLDDEVELDEAVEAEWGREIARRLDELDRGAVKAVPWLKARKAILRAR